MAPKRVAHGRFHGNNNVSQDVGIDAAELSFLKRKRNDIGGLVFKKILPVDGLNARVIDEGDAEFLIRAIHDFQETGNCRANFAPVEFIKLLPVFELNFHRIPFWPAHF